MLDSLKEAPKHLAEYSIAKILQSNNRLSELTTTGVGEDINTGTPFYYNQIDINTAGDVYLFVLFDDV